MLATKYLTAELHSQSSGKANPAFTFLVRGSDVEQCVLQIDAASNSRTEICWPILRGASSSRSGKFEGSGARWSVTLTGSKLTLRIRYWWRRWELSISPFQENGVFQSVTVNVLGRWTVTEELQG